MDGTLQVKSDPSKENFFKRTRDHYHETCTNHFDKYLSPNYRSASLNITLNEEKWLEDIGAKSVIQDLPYSPGKERYFAAKSKNELQIWQRSIEPWNSTCASGKSFKSSVASLTHYLSGDNSEQIELYEVLRSQSNEIFMYNLTYFISMIVLLYCVFRALIDVPRCIEQDKHTTTVPFWLIGILSLAVNFIVSIRSSVMETILWIVIEKAN